MKPLTQLIGQAPGNVVALVQNGKVVESALFLDGEAQQAPAAAMTALALLVTALATWLLARLTLCPLRRVADTAAEVATLPLDREHYATTPRVAEKDTDPRTEVGRSGW